MCAVCSGLFALSSPLSRNRWWRLSPSRLGRVIQPSHASCLPLRRCANDLDLRHDLDYPRFPSLFSHSLSRPSRSTETPLPPPPRRRTFHVWARLPFLLFCNTSQYSHFLVMWSFRTAVRVRYHDLLFASPSPVSHRFPLQPLFMVSRF
jgi:hypothetical protein